MTIFPKSTEQNNDKILNPTLLGKSMTRWGPYVDVSLTNICSGGICPCTQCRRGRVEYKAMYLIGQSPVLRRIPMPLDMIQIIQRYILYACLSRRIISLVLEPCEISVNRNRNCGFGPKEKIFLGSGWNQFGTKTEAPKKTYFI